jgi:hypothetical protein
MRCEIKIPYACAAGILLEEEFEDTKGIFSPLRKSFL